METLICVITIPCTFWPTLASDLGFLVLNRQSDRFTRIKQDDVDLLDWFPTKQFACLHQLLLQYNSWFSVLRPQAEWIFRSVRQRSRGDLHFVAVNLANSKALNLVPFLQWHLLGTWSIAPPNHPMMPWPSMAYKTQFLHLNGHNFGHIHKFCPYHSYIMFFHLQYIYIFHDIVPPHHIPTFHAGSSTPVVPQQQRLVHIQILIQLIGEAKGIAPWPDVEEDTVPRPASMEASSENLSGRMGKPRKHKIGGVLGVLILDVPLSPMTKIHILPYWKRC